METINDKLFSKVYVLNLEKDSDRREHIISEFSRIGLDDYIFFKATPADDPEVKALYSNGQIRTFPPCVHCGNTKIGDPRGEKVKKDFLTLLSKDPEKAISRFSSKNLIWCKLNKILKIKWLRKNIDNILRKKGYKLGGRCNCVNRELKPTQVANILSFKYLIKDIADKKIPGLIMICEDDVKFTETGFDQLQYMLSKESLKANSLTVDKPLLIQIGSLYDPSHHETGETPYFSKNRFLSNPCFVINLPFACCHIIRTSNSSFEQPICLSLQYSRPIKSSS